MSKAAQANEIIDRIAKRTFPDLLDVFEVTEVDGKQVIHDEESGSHGFVVPDKADSRTSTVFCWMAEKACTVRPHAHSFGGNEDMLVIRGWCKYAERGIALNAGDRLSIPAIEKHTVSFSDNFLGYVTFTPEHPIKIIKIKGTP